MPNEIIKEDLHVLANRKIPWDKLKNKTVLVTGSTGMLLTYVVYCLFYLNKAHPDYHVNIIAAARNRNKAEVIFKNCLDNPFFSLLIGDVCHPICLDKKVDYIIHGASLASSQYYGVDPVGTLLPNILGTYHLLEFARSQNVDGFLFFSSGEIYGNITEAVSIIESSYGKLDPLDIRNCYSESKRMGEAMCKAWNIQYHVPAQIARIFHAYGPTMDINGDQRVFSEFVRNILKNQDIEMKSDGCSKRAFCYIVDAIAALFTILFCGNSGEAYNVCGDEFITIEQLAQTLVGLFPEKQLKVTQRKRFYGEAYIENKNAGDIPPCNLKLKALGWHAQYSVKEGFKRTIDALRMGSDDYA